MRALLAWLRSHPKCTIAVAVIPLVWVAYVFFGWMTERDWQQYCKEARARGVKITFAELETAAISDGENFAALPMFKAAFDAPPGAAPEPFRLPRPPLNKSIQSVGGWKEQPYDWASWQKAFLEAKLIEVPTDNPVADVLRGFERFAPQIREWQKWQERPRCRFQMDWSSAPNTRFPHLGMLQGASHFFGMRMRAHLAHGDSRAALVDFQDAFQSYRALRHEPTLLSGLVRVAVLAVVLARVGNGLEQHAWTEPELQAIDNELAAVRIWDDYRQAITTERVFANASFDRLFSLGRGERSQMISQTTQANRAFGGSQLSPSAEDLMTLTVSQRKIRKNQLRINRYFDELAMQVNRDGTTIDVQRPLPSAMELDPGYLDLWQNFLFEQATRNFAAFRPRYFFIAAQLHQTRMALALERFRLAHGTFPETLDALVPEFLPELPPDPWTNTPMKYRRTDTGSFLLYAVGENRRDDDGVIDLKKSERNQHDAIWLYAPP